MFVRSPGRGGSVCRHSWISDLPASVSFSLSLCVSLSPSLSLLPLLHLPLFSHHVDLVSFLYKRLRERWQRLHGPWFLFCFVLFCCWGSLKKTVGLPPCSPSVLTRLYQRLRWSTCHPWTNHCDWGLNSLIGQVPVRSPFGLKEWVSPCHSHWGGEGLEARYTQAIFWTLFCPFYRHGPQSKKMSNLRMQTHQSISKILSEKQNSDGHSASKGPPHLVLRSGYLSFWTLVKVVIISFWMLVKVLEAQPSKQTSSPSSSHVCILAGIWDWHSGLLLVHQLLFIWDSYVSLTFRARLMDGFLSIFKWITIYAKLIFL